MYPHSFLRHYLWIAPHALQIIIAIVMLRRGLFREFPMFFTYTVFQILEEGTLFILDHSAAVSGYQYWCAHSVGLAIDIALRFAILFEVFTSVLRNYPGLKQLCRILFRGAVLVLLFAAITVAARAPQFGMFPFLTRIHVLDLSVDVMQSGLLILAQPFLWHCGRSGDFLQCGSGDGGDASLDRAGGRVRLRLCHHGDLSLLRGDLAGVPPGA